MMNYSGEAELIPESGDAIPIRATLRQGQTGRLKSWDGRIASADGRLLHIDPGQYTIRMPDGQEGTLLVRSVSFTSRLGVGTIQSIDVSGSGPAPF